LRRKTGMSQAVFARVLNVSTKTVQSWEQGDRKPSHAALRMLQILRENPKPVFEIMGIPAKTGGRKERRIKNSA
jgi:DNA-binding transcriptional regulator YiaG